MSRVRIPYLQTWNDKNTGHSYTRFRKRGHPLVRLPDQIGSKEFWRAYEEALGRKPEVGKQTRSKAGTVSAAIAAYYVSHQWGELSEGTRNMRRAILERFREPYGEWPLGRLRESFITAYLATLKPHAARNTLKALRGYLRHAGHDVTKGIAPPKARSIKRPSWTPEQIAQYEAHHPIGSRARLAFALARWTGVGCSEVTRMGPSHMRNGEIVIARQKTKVEATITVHPELRAVLDATPITGLSTFLITKSGKPFRSTDLSEQFRAWCDEAGLPKTCYLHGLRHTVGDGLAETGSNPNEIASVLGHASAKSALHYTQGADRKRMARSAMKRWIGGTQNEPVVSSDNPDWTVAKANTLTDKAK
jgi:integrase